MNKLPEPIWISLQETLDLVLERTGADPEVAKRSLIDAFAARKIETRGWGRTHGPDDDRPSSLSEHWHGATVSWEYGKLCPASGTYHGIRYVSFDEIEVRHEHVTQWLAGGPDPAHEGLMGLLAMGVMGPALSRLAIAATPAPAPGSTLAKNAGGRQPIEPRIGMEKINQWLQKRYDKWNGIPAGPSLSDDWDAARENFGRNKVTREQIQNARMSVNAPKSFRIHQRGRKPKLTH